VVVLNFFSAIVMKMKKLNGYSVAVRLCEYSTSTGTGLPFPVLCKIFGPLYWEGLSTLEKLYFKQLAIHYSQTAVGIAERAGALPTREALMDAIFGVRTIEKEKVIGELAPINIKIYHMGYREICNMTDD
jgi:hypothetical protein